MLLWRSSRRWSLAVQSGVRWEQQTWTETGKLILDVDRETFTTWGKPERWCSLCLWRFLSSSWMQPWAAWSDPRADPAEGRRLDQRPPELPSSLSYPAILCSHCPWATAEHGAKVCLPWHTPAHCMQVALVGPRQLCVVGPMCLRSFMNLNILLFVARRLNSFTDPQLSPCEVAVAFSGSFLVNTPVSEGETFHVKVC